jgi:hypothetical protein
MLTAERIQYLLEAVNAELALQNIRGEMFLAGGWRKQRKYWHATTLWNAIRQGHGMFSRS